MKKIFLSCSLFLTAFPLLAADNPWVGKWKLDPAKSHLTGFTFTYSKAPNGMIHYSDGADYNFDFGLDGKEYPRKYGVTTTWNQVNDSTWDSVTKQKGVEISKSHREISADGKTYTIVTTGTSPSGTPFKETQVSTRLSGSKGLIGKWRTTKLSDATPSFLIVDVPSAGMLQWEDPDGKSEILGKTDGSFSPFTGPQVLDGTMISFKYLSPHKLAYTIQIKDKVIQEGVQTLAADGKTLADTSWDPAKKLEKTTGFYFKQ